MKRLFLLALSVALLNACSDIELVTDKDKSFSVVQHTNKVQVYDYDELVFQSDCSKRVKIETFDNTTYIKLSNGSEVFTWSEVHQFELSGHQYMFKKVRCD